MRSNNNGKNLRYTFSSLYPRDLPYVRSISTKRPKCRSAGKYTGSQCRKIRNPDLHSAFLSDIIDCCNRTYVAAQDRHIHIEPLQMVQDASRPSLLVPPKSKAFNHTSSPHQPRARRSKTLRLDSRNFMTTCSIVPSEIQMLGLFIPKIKLFALTVPGFRNLGANPALLWVVTRYCEQAVPPTASTKRRFSTPNGWEPLTALVFEPTVWTDGVTLTACRIRLCPPCW